MGQQLTGIDATITSWGSSGDDCYHIVNTGAAPHKISIKIAGQPIDITAAGDTASKFRNGLMSWTGTVSAYVPKTTRKIGISGLVTFASGYVLHCDKWDMTCDFGALDITELTGAATQKWRSFRPMKIGKLSGSFGGNIDSGTALSPPVDWTGSSAAATFKVSEEGATDNTLACNIVAHSLDTDADIGQDSLQKYVYSYSVDGAVTVAGSENFLPSGTMATPAWDNDTDGVPDRSLVVKLASGRTMTGAAYLKGWTIKVAAGEIISLDYSIQGAGALTLA